MLRLTVEDIMSLRPCPSWTMARVREAMRGRVSVTASDIPDAEHVPAKDRIWLLIKGGFFDRNDLILIAAAFVEHVLPLHEIAYPNDSRPRDATQAAATAAATAAAAAAATVAAVATPAESATAAYAAAYWASAAAKAKAFASVSSAADYSASAADTTDRANRLTAARLAGLATAAEHHYQLSVIKQHLDAQQEDTQC